MNMHKRVCLTPRDRKAICETYSMGNVKIAHLTDQYRVSRPTTYKALAQARKQEFRPPDSTNNRFRALKYGLKRLAKVEKALQVRLKAQARRYNKVYPGELMHFYTRRLPVLDGETQTQRKEHLFKVIVDFSRGLYTTILPDRTQYSPASFL